MGKITHDKDIEKAEFTYYCRYCEKEIKKIKPETLKNCVIHCDCGNFLRKDSYISKKLLK